MKILYFFLFLTVTACSSDSKKEFGNLEDVKADFIHSLLTDSQLEEGPFSMHYHLRSILFSDRVVSLLGEIFVRAHLPHGWTRYEGKTYVKLDRFFKVITLNDLFPKADQKEFLSSYCENYFKHHDPEVVGVGWTEKSEK